MSCNDESLEKFSVRHYTYINQIFGDLTVREIISEVFPNKKYEFDVEETGPEFENSFHHILKNKKTDDVVCSVNSGYQNISINKNDTLCQSYSLMAYFKQKIYVDMVKRQMGMIDMYRNILLSNKDFIKALDDIIYKENSKHWVDFTKEGRKKVYLKMDKAEIIKNIKSVLDDWEKFGFWFFILDGKCPDSKTLKKADEKKNKITRKNRSA